MIDQPVESGLAPALLNERAVRAAAGILFLFAIVSFMNAWLLGNFAPTRVFVVAFLVDFGLRIFVSARLSPSLIVGQWLVRMQQPEFVGAAQKRFAWSIGFVLALAMLYLVVIERIVGPVNLVVCAICLLLLFLETAFGICLGCIVYERLPGTRRSPCPGQACDYVPAPGAGGTPVQGLVVVAFVAAIGLVAPEVAGENRSARASPAASAGIEAASERPAVALEATEAAEAERCRVPAFAKAIGHEQIWKLHNHCN